MTYSKHLKSQAQEQLVLYPSSGRGRTRRCNNTRSILLSFIASYFYLLPLINYNIALWTNLFNYSYIIHIKLFIFFIDNAFGAI